MTTDDRRAILALSASELAAAYRSAELSPVEVTDVVVAAAAEAGERYGAIASLDPSGACRAARSSEQRWHRDEPLGPLDGIPLTLKDSFHVTGMPRWHGTAASDGPLSTHDAAPVRRIKEAGGVIVAKTTMPDFAMVMSGLSSQHGVIRNPWDPSTNPGGSSSGAAVCLAAGVAPLALGTDMVGSVRVPAALCGLVSLCPTRGRIAYDPPAAYRSAGPIARRVKDAESLLAVVGRHDPVDHFALPGAFQPALNAIDRLDGLRFGVMRDLDYGDPVDADTRRALEAQLAQVADLGAEVIDVPPLEVDAEDYEAIIVLLTQKGITELHTLPPHRRRDVLPQITGTFEDAYLMSALAYGLAMSRLDAAAVRVRRQLAAFDYVISPVIPVHAFSATDVSPNPQDGAMTQMAFVCWFNQIGSPAGSLPIWRRSASGVPISVQIAGRRHDDAGVLQVMELLETTRGFDVDYPVIGSVSISTVQGVDADALGRTCG